MNMKITAISCAVALLVTFSAGASQVRRITSEGDYPSHLQGVCSDGNNIWWSHTTELVRTDRHGKVLAHAKGLANHHGDLCVVSGIVYVAVNLGRFNTEQNADSWVYSYNGEDLRFVRKWKVPELRHGAGGITWKDGRFYVVGGLPPTHDRNYVYEYDNGFSFIDRHVLESGWTHLGIQTADYSGGKFVFGCYGGKNRLTGAKVPVLALVTGPDFSGLVKVRENVSTGNVSFDGRRWKGVMNLIDKNVKPADRRYHVSLVPVGSKEL